MTRVVMTGRSIKGRDRFIWYSSFQAGSAFTVLRMGDAAAAAGLGSLAGAGGFSLEGHSRLAARQHAQLAIDDHHLALGQGALDRVMDAVVEQHLHRALLDHAI